MVIVYVHRPSGAIRLNGDTSSAGFCSLGLVFAGLAVPCSTMSDTSLPPPVVLALLVADNRLLDSQSNQHTIVGVFSQVKAERFPTMLARLCIYAELTNGRGAQSITIRIVDSDESRPPVINAGVNIEFSDPLDVSQVGFGASGVVFPAPGEYRVQLLSGTTVLMERRLMVFQVPSGAGFQSPPTTPVVTPPESNPPERRPGGGGPDLPPGMDPGWAKP